MTAQAVKVEDQVQQKTGTQQTAKPADKPQEKRRALGRGLESLLPTGPRMVTPPATPSSPQASEAEVISSTIAAAGPEAASTASRAPETESATRSSAPTEIPIAEIGSNPYQTRKQFDQRYLEDLAESIRAQGVIQPIVVRPATPPYNLRHGYDGAEQRYVLILGERRLRASELAGRTTIPAIVKRVSEQQAAEMTLVENLQRQDLNCLDQARAFRSLSENFRLTQEEIGKRVGVSREAVSNYMRLLRLPASVQGFLEEGKLTYSHARILLMIEDDDALETMAEKTVNEKMSVAKLEEIVTELQFGSQVAEEDENAKKRRGARWVDPNVRAAQRNLETILGMRVSIRDKKGKGTIRIEYKSIEDFDRVVGMLNSHN